MAQVVKITALYHWVEIVAMHHADAVWQEAGILVTMQPQSALKR